MIERDTLGRYALAALSGGLLAASYAMHPLWWAAWLAPVPLIIATSRTPVVSRRWLTLLAGALGGISSFSYHLTVGGWGAAILILVLVALAWSSVIRLAVTFAERGHLLPAVLAVPVSWAAIDTLLIHLSPHGSAGSIAYSQMNALPIIQVASLGGVPLITFVALLPGCLLGVLLSRKWDTGWHRWSAACCLGIAACLIFGVVRLEAAPAASGTSVALIATDGIGQLRSWEAFRQVYGGAIGRMVAPGRIVVLPEAVVRLPDGAADRAGRMLAAYATRARAMIVVGIVVDQQGVLTNRALIARPDGTFRWYLKQHLVPGVEADITPGTSPVVMRDGTTRVGVAICKDMHFPTLARDYARRDARLMLVPAYDFDVDDWLTARMTILRGVESGSSIARAARHGISFVSDRYGRVLAERRSTPAMGALVVNAPADPGDTTFYARFGDLFGWGCVLIWAVLLAFRGLPGTAERIFGIERQA